MKRHFTIATRIGCWLLLVFLPMAALAHNEPETLSGYSMRRFTDENGLPQNSIKAMASDGYGFIWMATESGLVRFDGNTFRTYGKKDLGLLSTRLLGFVPGKRPGELLAITDVTQIISIYQGKVSHAYDLPRAYYSLYSRYGDPGNDTKFGYPQYHWSPIENFNQLYVADSRSYYACSADRIRYYINEWQIFDFPYRQDSLYSFFLLEGRLYLHASGNRFMTLENHKGLREFTVDIPRLPATDGQEGGPHVLWNGISGNAYLYQAEHLYQLYRKKNGDLGLILLLQGFRLMQHNIYSVHHDPVTGTLFLGSSTEGLYIFKKHAFTTLETGRGGDFDVFYAHQYYGNNTVVTPQGYILGPDVPPTHVSLSKAEMGGWRYTMLTTHGARESIWMGDKDKLVEMDHSLQRKNVYSFPDLVNLIYEGLDGSIWIGNFNKGIYRLNPNEPDAQPEFYAPVRYSSFLWQTEPEHLWIATQQGLCRLNIATRQCIPVPEFKDIHVRSLYSTQASQVWITTYGDGFFLLKDGELTRMPLDRAGYLSASHCIREDRRGYFWITSNKGLFQVAKADLLAYADGKASEVYYFYYGKESGFITNEFNGGCEPCAVEWGDGSFSFPSLDGLVRFNPYAIKPEFPDKGIFFDHIELDGKPLAAEDTLTLSPDFNRITFYVTTPYQGNANNLHLEASLQKNYGDVLWTSLDANNGISFTTLPPGTYRLVIRKPKGFGVGNYGYRTLVLLVPPAFWQTGWFMALAALLLVLGVYAIIRSRIRYVQRRNQELERIITERTQDLRETIKALRQSKNTLARQSQLQQKMILAFSHDLKSPLMYLMITGQKLYENLRGTPGKVLNSIQIMYHSAFNMYHFTDNFLNYAKVYFLNERPGRERFSLRELAQEKIEIFRYIAEAKNIELRNQLPEDMSVYMNRMLLSIIFHNLLDNAIKYTDEGYIDFSVETTETGLHISITDTGMGMEEHVKKQYADIFDVKLEEEYINEGAGKGLGLQIVQELMHILGGHLHIHSEPEHGTTITLHFKKEVLGSRGAI